MPALFIKQAETAGYLAPACQGNRCQNIIFNNRSKGIGGAYLRYTDGFVLLHGGSDRGVEQIVNRGKVSVSGSTGKRQDVFPVGNHDSRTGGRLEDNISRRLYILWIVQPLAKMGQALACHMQRQADSAGFFIILFHGQRPEGSDKYYHTAGV